MIAGLLVLALCPACLGFNVDTQVPVIKQAGVPGGMFGFSVTMHQQSDGQQRYLLLAGAPQDAAPSGVNVNRTGALYACPITMSKSDCFRVSIEQESQPGRNLIENMWLGVTVESQGPGGRVLVCAHRYTSVQAILGTREEQYRMIGKCYVRGNDLLYNSQDEWQTYHNEMCNVNTDLDKTGMCQMGISGGFINNMLYFGAPGAYTWQGADFILQRVKSDFGIDDTVDISSPRENLYNIYMGYTVKLGTGVLHEDLVTVLSGAPRWQHKGAVYISDIEAPTMILRQTLNGDQVGSYFGSVIALADFNNDGWQEIVVGAPYYFDRKEDVGGAVYIYNNEVGSFTDKPSMVLYGPAASGFGFAVANIGDINQDGFTDLAVGAPFEEMGKVYIYHSKSSGLQSKPSQIIEGSQVGGIPTFGYSISGGLDVDDNSYPDLLVGSLADQIALLRSRPVINISKEFSVTPTLVDPNKCTQTSCMDVRFCFSYILSTGNAKYKKNITLQYTVDADFDRRPTRVKFVGAPGAVYKGFFSMPETKCQNLQLHLLDNILNKLHPIHISLKYSILDRELKPRPNVASLDNFPVLNEDQSTEQIVEVDFQKECGADNVCRSNLQMEYEFVGENNETLSRVNGSQILHFDPDVKKLLLRVIVTNAQSPTSPADDAHEAMLNITFPAELAFAFVFPPIALTYVGSLLCSLGNPFRRNQRVEINITFETTRITLRTREVTTQLQLSTSSKQANLDERYANFLVEYNLQTSLSVKPVNRQTYFSGKVLGESAMKRVNDVGSPLNFTFTVISGSEPLNNMGSLILAVEWPHEVANGKWLLYPTEVLVNTGNVTRCHPPGDVINPLNLTVSSCSSLLLHKRRRETAESIDVLSLPAIKREKPNTLLKCRGGGANCVRFECALDNMKNTATVTVKARVWNSTFLEDYRQVDRVWVEGTAELYLKTNVPSINMQTHHVLFSVAIDSELEETPPVEIPLWLIIVSAGSGILLLGAIILCLWMCGFFRRANTRAKYEVRGQKAEMKVQPSETERLTQDS
ncbi:PREDICTED: integrin alpha-3 [Nanorana parkeri]|uniref:integrin alpha-3 n=1 Tax=Nanorana parkeri TaxID=125878 RepID=UPI0008550342|nr:PREDICTED: integrin alpha-3 [Nanorana parkeri]